jgi:hypothetical protein
MPIISKRKLITNVAAYAPAAGGGGGGFTANGVQFGGSTDYIVDPPPASFTGLTNSKTGTISMWINVAANGEIVSTQTTGFVPAGIQVRSLNTFIQCKLFNSAGTEIANIAPNSGFGSGAGIPPDTTSYDWRTLGWRWLAFSWNLAGTARMQAASNVYTTAGSLDLFDGSSITDDTVSYPVGYSFVGSHGFGSAGYSGGLAELIFFGGTSLDLSNSTVRSKFISASGHPVDLGSTGSIPTGSNPTYYFKGPAASFATNAAGTGNLALWDGSAVTNSSTNP